MRRREEETKARHPVLGRVILALSEPPAHTRSWMQGAQGERIVGGMLDSLHDAVVLHDRQMRRTDGRLTRGNIDHLVVVPCGVWVVDAKTHRGSLRIRRGSGPGFKDLFINGRNQNRLLRGIQNQVAAVRRELAPLGSVPVHGALCFVGTDLPWPPVVVHDIPLLGRRELRKRLSVPGPVGSDERNRIASLLAHRFPAAD